MWTCAPGRTAIDGLFAKAFCDQLTSPCAIGRAFPDLMRAVGTKMSGKQQQCYISGPVSHHDICFVHYSDSAVTTAAPDTSTTDSSTSDTNAVSPSTEKTTTLANCDPLSQQSPPQQAQHAVVPIDHIIWQQPQWNTNVQPVSSKVRGLFALSPSQQN